jgi:transcriptional regulator with XRE-family HTH domain
MDFKFDECHSSGMRTDPYTRSNEAIGARLELTRKALGIRTQKDFAERAEIEANTYNQWVKGKARPDLTYAWRLRDEYGLSLDWIYVGDLSGTPYQLTRLIMDQFAKEQETATSKIADTRLFVTSL